MHAAEICIPIIGTLNQYSVLGIKQQICIASAFSRSLLVWIKLCYVSVFLHDLSSYAP